ncbi:hypothetical protein RchiOBHm_Chr7g0235691 [Rosa chinensis]|uniref:Uncharacterized protein n=1 Tax=Rosa chinensis TaxID=74649 RepID=A0A2P6PGQ9_ROSCH|nr:hypothetical protein RchiOBHm_Chr7g0235691 [Rosa chinensis]
MVSYFSITIAFGLPPTLRLTIALTLNHYRSQPPSDSPSLSPSITIALGLPLTHHRSHPQISWFDNVHSSKLVGSVIDQIDRVWFFFGVCSSLN